MLHLQVINLSFFKSHLRSICKNKVPRTKQSQTTLISYIFPWCVSWEVHMPFACKGTKEAPLGRGRERQPAECTHLTEALMAGGSPYSQGFPGESRASLCGSEWHRETPVSGFLAGKDGVSPTAMLSTPRNLELRVTLCPGGKSSVIVSEVSPVGTGVGSQDWIIVS